MQKNLVLIDRDDVIEEALGLDKGTLVREDSTYYRAEIDGDSRVAIYVQKLNGGKIFIESMKTPDEDDAELALEDELEEFINKLETVNHIPSEVLMQMYDENWVLTLGEMRIEIPFNADTYDAFLKALEEIQRGL